MRLQSNYKFLRSQANIKIQLQKITQGKHLVIQPGSFFI